MAREVGEKQSCCGTSIYLLMPCNKSFQNLKDQNNYHFIIMSHGLGFTGLSQEIFTQGFSCNQVVAGAIFLL